MFDIRKRKFVNVLPRKGNLMSFLCISVIFSVHEMKPCVLKVISGIYVFIHFFWLHISKSKIIKLQWAQQTCTMPECIDHDATRKPCLRFQSPIIAILNSHLYHPGIIVASRPAFALNSRKVDALWNIFFSSIGAREHKLVNNNDAFCLANSNAK